MKKLTDKQKRFCMEYLKDFNATQASIRAGYSKKTATVIGHEHLMKPHISEYILNLKNKLTEKTTKTLEEIIREVERLGFSDIRKVFEHDGRLKHIVDIDDDTAASIQEITVRKEISDGDHVADIIKYKMADKKGSLDMLMKYHGAYEKDNKQKTNDVVIVGGDPFENDSD